MNRAEKRRQQKLAEKAAGSKKHARPDVLQSLDLAVQHHGAGRLAEAEGLYRQVLQADPDQPVALHLLGTIALQTNNSEAAVELISKALSIQPDYVDALSNLGLALHKERQLEDAISSFDKAIALKPDFAEAYCNKGVVLGELGRADEAKRCFQKAVSLKPDYIQAHFNLGNALKNIRQFEGAITSYNKAIAINPRYAEAYVNRGIALQDLERSDEAVTSYRKAMEINPDDAKTHSSLIFIQDLISIIDQTEQQAERQRWNDKFILPLAEKVQPHTNIQDPERRLRIGYVSADFRRHSAYLGFAPLIMDYDRQNFDVICYDTTLVADEISETLRAAATDWRDIRNISDEELAVTIREDAIDILVDLSGHTVDNRLRLFGYKPAPLQVTGIGHLAPGLSTIDYRLTTDRLTPPDEESIYPEQPIYLDTYFGFTPPTNSPPVGPSPCQKNGFITFGFLGRFSKTSDANFALWAKILQDLPVSRLLLKYSQLDDPDARQKITQTFSNFDITEDRLILLGHSEQYAHLDAHNRVDIVFDTIPHGGGITTLESLWMGVPVIGLLDANKAGGRVIDCMCGPVGLKNWVARNTEEYHAIALQWADQVEELATMRQQLRQRVSDVYGHFPWDVEKSYRLIWKRWCAGEVPSPLHPGTAKI